MNYQELVDNIRKRTNFFARVNGGGWPGHDGPAKSRYPNLAAELDALEWDIITPSETANISREVLAGVLEDGDMLSRRELFLIADRMNVSYSYLHSPVLSFVDPSTNKGKYRISILRKELEDCNVWDMSGWRVLNAKGILASLDNGIPVTYAAWRFYTDEIRYEISSHVRKKANQQARRTERIVLREEPECVQVGHTPKEERG